MSFQPLMIGGGEAFISLKPEFLLRHSPPTNCFLFALFTTNRSLLDAHQTAQ
jgi:hypothetical protein